MVYTPPNSKWPYIQNWFLSVQRQLPKDTVLEVSYNGNHSSRLPIIADYNQAAPNAPGATLVLHRARADTDFRADHAGSIRWAINHYNGLSARVEHRLHDGLVPPELVHLGECDGRFRTGPRIFRGLLPGQSAEHSQPGRGKGTLQLRREVE